MVPGQGAAPRGGGAPIAGGNAAGNDTGATRRSIDIFEGDALDETALAELVRAAIAYLEGLSAAACAMNALAIVTSARITAFAMRIL